MWFRAQAASWQDIAALTRRMVGNEQELQRDFWRKLKNALADLPFAEDLLAAYYCAFDRQTPLHVKAVLLGAIEPSNRAKAKARQIAASSRNVLSRSLKSSRPAPAEKSPSATSTGLRRWARPDLTPVAAGRATRSGCLTPLGFDPSAIGAAESSGSSFTGSC